MKIAKQLAERRMDDLNLLASKLNEINQWNTLLDDPVIGGFLLQVWRLRDAMKETAHSYELLLRELEEQSE
ncbi:MAG: hypothetical protein Ta2A_11630 [Treponemataceae bacterium]|nr:MAG: hypothetical protein Ta2A_11630 [Treponemataceae bacterium]